MIDINMPPQKKYAVVNDNDNILLVTSSLTIASWYQILYNKLKPPHDHRIGCDYPPIFRKHE